MKPLTYPSVVILLFLAATSSTCSFADDSDPVAIRSWPDGGVTIETMWNLHVGSGLTETTKKQLPHPLSYDVDQLKPDEFATVRRLPNEPLKVLMNKQFDAKTGKANDVVVSKNHPQKNESDPNHDHYAANFSVDGVEVTLLNHLPPEQVMKELATPDDNAPKKTNRRLPFGIAFDIEIDIDVIVANDDSYDETVLRKIASQLKPRILVVNRSLKKIGDQDVAEIPHNTLAVCSAKDSNTAGTRFVSLTDKPYALSAELTKLFEKKETACKNSRETFAKLSVEQMNFRPPNGTHTPRWNSEHMMGREFLFFSQIYHAIDPNIPVMDLNPRQNPDDYEMAHPDWTGEEEARQTARVEEFTRRFAYLLDGVDLNRKAKGSKFWTPRALLKQMERHYNQHTANVRKKMQLDEWPNP